MEGAPTGIVCPVCETPWTPQDPHMVCTRILAGSPNGERIFEEQKEEYSRLKSAPQQGCPACAANPCRCITCEKCGFMHPIGECQGVPAPGFFPESEDPFGDMAEDYDDHYYDQEYDYGP